MFVSIRVGTSATFVIANGDVAGLKSAMTTANSNNQNDVIELAANGTYTVTTRDNGFNGLPKVAPDNGHTLTIHGNGATILRNASTTFRFFYVQSGASLILSGLTLSNGNGDTGHGGAIYNDADTASVKLTITGCTFTNNTSIDYGGAIFNNGYSEATSGSYSATLTVNDSTFSNNSGAQYGGAIWTASGAANAGVTGSSILNVSNCTFIGNTATRSAGAIQQDGSFGTASGSILNCTFSQNSAGNFGGAINVDGGSGSANLTITNCTFDQNTASNSPSSPSAGWGGALAMDGSDGNATVNVSNCTFNGNSARLLGGGIYVSSSGGGTTALKIGNNILKSGSAGANLATDGAGTFTVTSVGYNLSSDAAGGGSGTAPAGFLNHVGDKRNTAPLLDPAGLKDNGGATHTIALQSGSPALDQGKSNTISSSNIDQRSEFRPYDDPNLTNAPGGDGSDIGAYEAVSRTIGSKKSGSNLQIDFMTVLGRNYEVQMRTSLMPSATWMTANNTTPAPPISGTGGVIHVTVPGAFNQPSDFYRLHQLP